MSSGDVGEISALIDTTPELTPERPVTVEAESAEIELDEGNGVSPSPADVGDPESPISLSANVSFIFFPSIYERVIKYNVCTFSRWATAGAPA